MSKVLLFLTILVSPPSKPGQEVWSLQTTDKIEFEEMQSCVAFGKLIQQRYEPTGTTRIRGWCVDQSNGFSTNKVKPGKDSVDTSKAQEFYSNAAKPQADLAISDDAARRFCQDEVICEIAAPSKGFGRGKKGR